MKVVPSPGGTSGKEPICQCGRHEMQVQSLDQEDPLERKCQPTPVFLPGESHGQQSLLDYSPWDHKELDTTEWITHMHIHIQQVHWSCKSRLKLTLNLDLEVRALCPHNPCQPGCGGGGPLWVPSYWDISWRTCFISDHTFCFWNIFCFIGCWNGESWVSRWFWLSAMLNWIQLLDGRHTPEKPKINANFNRVVYLSFTLCLISMNEPQIQSKDHVKGRKLRKERRVWVLVHDWYNWSFIKTKD